MRHLKFRVWDKLERERDEAIAAIVGWENKWKCAVEMAAQAEVERDEAIADRDIARLSALDSDRAHDRMVGELEKVYKERDDALSQIVQAECRAERFCQERDEAREEAGHWKTEYEIVVDRLRGRKHPRDNGIIADDEIIPKLERERDEAREQLAAAKHFLEKYIAERDEARRKCANLEEIIRVEWPIVTVEALIRQAKESAK